MLIIFFFAKGKFARQKLETFGDVSLASRQNRGPSAEKP